MLNKSLLILAVIITFIYFVVGGRNNGEFGASASTQDKIEAKLAEGFAKKAKEINATTPIMVDAQTRLDKVTAGPGALATYYYTFPNFSASEIDSNSFRSDLRNSVKSSVCASKEMKSSLVYGGKYKYIYAGKNGLTIVSFTFDRHDCGYAAKYS
ncbi:MAG TPA: hypothetical protein VIM93_12175 [Kangiella sp.]